MAARVSRLHHVSLHVSNAVQVARTLASRFQFAAVGARVTAESRQLALRKGAAVFVVNERREDGRDLHDFRNGYLYDVRPRYAVDSACNVCFEVEDVADSCARLRDRGCDVIVPPTEVGDPDGGGSVTYSIVKSIVGNVCHTLLDRSRYEGGFLPGFRRVEDVTDSDPDAGSRCPVTHFDHVTFACPRRSTGEVMRWYEENFGFQRFFISSNEDVEEGYVLNQDGIGLRLTAMEYWKCSEAGLNIPFKHQTEPDCKFVVAESLPEQGRNQVDSFLQQHGGPGIQHIGLFTKNIVSTAQTMAKDGVEFVCPPPAYYTEVRFTMCDSNLASYLNFPFHLKWCQSGNGKFSYANFSFIRVEVIGVALRFQPLYLRPPVLSGVSEPYGRVRMVGKQHEILEAGHDPEELKQHGILLDTDLRDHGDRSGPPSGRYLLQVFTKPIFSKDTFFLELIERRGATGFGEGNIRALWRSIQFHMDSEEREHRLDSD
ncbi:hypothetical protein NFI96_017859 [Prochilodus magdalenae]|nr:hypothetical protein NFI96_017859 [Prochilodus magdalenae]